MMVRWIRLAAATGACAFTVAAHGQFAQPKPAQQLKLGLQAAEEIRRKEKVLPANDFRVRTLRRVAQRLLSTLPAQEQWQFTFDVIDNKQVNAFALPGGPIFFYSGILDKMNTEDELAGVLAHELTHIRREHWARQYRDAQNRSLWVSAGLVIFGANRNAADAAGFLNGLVDAKYSRGHEVQADDDGVKIMTDAGYNPTGMADVFRMLQSQGGAKPPEFLSSHPSDKNRVRRIEAKAAALKMTFPPLTPMNLKSPGTAVTGGGLTKRTNRATKVENGWNRQGLSNCSCSLHQAG